MHAGVLPVSSLAAPSIEVQPPAAAIATPRKGVFGGRDAVQALFFRNSGQLSCEEDHQGVFDDQACSMAVEVAHCDDASVPDRLPREASPFEEFLVPSVVTQEVQTCSHAYYTLYTVTCTVTACLHATLATLLPSSLLLKLYNTPINVKAGESYHAAQQS